MEGYEIWLRLLILGLGAALGLLPAQRAMPLRLAGAPAAWALASTTLKEATAHLSDWTYRQKSSNVLSFCPLK